MKKNYDERYLYIDNIGNSHLQKHKLKKHKLDKLAWTFVKKVYKLKLRPCYVKDIPPAIHIQRPIFDIPRTVKVIIIDK